MPATVSGSETPAAQHAVASVESSTSGTSTSGAPVAASSSFGALEPMRQVQGLVGAALVLTALGAGLMMLSKTSTSKAKRATRKKVIEAAEADLQPADELSIAVADIEAAENEGTVKVHVELPAAGDIISFRVKKRRLGESFDELCAVILQGLPSGALTLEQLKAMEMQYEDKDGDMLALGNATDIGDLVTDAQAIFVSRRTKPTGTRIAAGPARLADGGSTCQPDLAAAAASLLSK